MFTTQNIPLILVLTGCAALLAGLSGGGFTIKDYAIPKITAFPRVMSGLVGLVLIGAATWLYARPASAPVPQPTEVAPTVAPVPSATFTSSPVNSPTVLPSATATQTPAPGTPTAVPPTATPIVADQTNPAGFLRYYYDLVTIHRDYGDAWNNLMTKKFQKAIYSNDYPAYGNYWNGIQKVDLDSVQVAPRPDSSVDCHVEMTLHMTSGLASKLIADYHLIYDAANRTWMFETP
jgi:hypothetical protein